MNKQKIASYIWPRYSNLIDKVNRNPLIKSYSKMHKDLALTLNRDEFFKYISDNIIKNEIIDYLEFGVYKGDSIKRWSTLDRNQDSRFYGFDTFTGLPEDWSSNFPKGSFDTGGVIPLISDPRVRFIKGLFQETLGPFLVGFKRTKRLVIFMDADLYSSTLYVLTMLHPLLIKNDIIMFDEFGSLIGEFKAYLDYTTSYKLNLQPIVMITGKGFVERIAFLVP